MLRDETLMSKSFDDTDHAQVEPGSQARTPRISCKLAFPMYCAPLSAVLEMKSVDSHEELVARGVVVNRDISDNAPIIFVSHQWVSTLHPDPEATQLSVFQGAVRRLFAGYVVRSDWLQSLVLMKDEVDSSWAVFLQNAVVWYDYFSVPQDASRSEDAKLAIQSIPAYIEMSAITFILVPTIDYTNANGETFFRDYYTWQQRGWCRLELLATHLKVNARSPVVIRSEGYVHFMSAGNKICHATVGEGDFGCCSLDHQHINPDGTASSFACDKVALFDIVRALIAHRMDFERTKGNLRRVRQLQSYSHIWLRNLLTVEDNFNAQCDTLDSFLATYSFTVIHDVDGGWTPLRFACISGNVTVARQLLEENADPEANLACWGGADFPVGSGFSILVHIAALCCCQEHVDILDLLVAHNAQVHSPKHMDALMAASINESRFKRGARWVLRTFPDWNVNRKFVGPNGFSLWALVIALVFGSDKDYLLLLCAHNADLTLQSSPMKFDALTIACANCPTSSPDIAESILRELRQQRWKPDVNSSTDTNIQSVHVDVNRRMAAPWLTHIQTPEGVRTTNCGPTVIQVHLQNSSESTVLSLAAAEGNHHICKWLLEQKADASIADVNGYTALSFAQERCFTRVVDVLRDAPALPIDE